MADRCGRSRVRRPDLLLGADAARPRAPRGGGGRAGRGGPRYDVRHPHRARGRAGRGDRRAHPGRPGAPGLLRHRGHDVRDPAGPGVHRSRRGREVRRLLPRPRGRAARLRRLGRCHVRPTRHARSAGVVDRPDAGAALQRPGCCREGVRRARGADRVPDDRGRTGEHGRGATRAGVQRVPGRDLPRARSPVRQRRGDDRLPRQPPGSVGPRRRRRGLATGPDDLREGDGWRLPRRGVRRPRRRDGPPRTGGPGVPGRHALREPGRGDRRAHHAAAGHRRGLRAHRRAPRRRSAPRSPRRSPPRACRTSSRRPARCSRSSSPTAPCATSTTRRAPTRRRTPRSSTPCSTAGSTCPPSAYEAWFLSSAHDDRAVQTVLDALPHAARAAAAAGGSN